ncbi:MAG: DUF6056 family protein [Candidatus Limiplasma sp.]|nr:DUF6056 family protein [Candidatus Limiplasma sp.]
MSAKSMPDNREAKGEISLTDAVAATPVRTLRHPLRGLEPEKRNRVWWYALLLAVFLCFYLFNALAPLMSDDYNYAFSFSTGERITSVGDLFPSIVLHYRGVNGRVAMHFLAQLMLLLGKAVFNVINALVTVLFFVGLCRLTVGRKKDPRLLAVLVGAWVILLPTLGQVMFWLVSACNYFWGITLILWLLVPFRDRVLGEAKPLTWWQIGLMLPAYAVMGTVSENSAPAAMLLMLLCCALQFRFHRKVKVWQGLAILFSLAGFLFMLSSPASQGRNAASLSQTASLLGRYLVPFTNCVTTFLNYELAPSIVFLILFSCALYAKAKPEILWLSAATYFCGVAANFAMSLTGYYPLRVMTGSLALILCACAMLLPLLRLAPLEPLLRGAEWALCLTAALLILQAIPQTYDRYREASAREARMIAARDAGELDVATTNISSRTKFDVFYDMIDLTDDPEYFSNAVFARYYGLHSVVVDELR